MALMRVLRCVLRPGIAACLLAASAQNAIADEPPQAAHERPADARHGNRLAAETSPYLLQHAHNPVDWHPWGEAAFALARESNRPVFLSIGYSSCHWCHVMERESFMDDEIAAFLNEHFVCIKVDREERPDVDEIYMTALQLMGGRGGWPLTVFLTADAKPFFGGTYWPPRDRQIDVDGEPVAATGLLTVLAAVADAWSTRHDELTAAAGRVTAAVELTLRRRSLAASEPLSAAWIDDVQAALASTFDPVYGGFGYSEATATQPKFPEPANLLFLLDRVRRSPNAEAEKMLVTTLDRLAAGGIRDHLGGGFHRYSTDRYWRVPHFEKMLYDNALLLSVYARAYAALGRDEYRDVAAEIVDFLARELRAPDGGLYSAIDADSQGAEGAFYVWDKDEIQRRLSPDERAAFAPMYVAAEPNFEDHWILEKTIPGALAADRSDANDDARGLSTDADTAGALLASAKTKLLAARGERTRPATDTKILCAWNGMAIRGLADAARLANIDGAADAARDCARFVLTHHKTADGRLMRSHAAEQARLNAYLDDYAFLIDGLIALHQATGEEQWLAAAEALMLRQIELFWDTGAGGFYYTSNDHPSLIARSKDPADSATPSANAVSAVNLMYLADALGKDEYRDRAQQTVQAFASLARQAPSAMPTMAVALSELLDGQTSHPSARPTAGTQK